MNRCTYTNEVWSSETSWTYLQVLFDPLCYLTELLNIMMVRDYEVM
jgi:hypothetical protein